MAALDAERHEKLPARWVEGSLACRNFEPRYAFYAKRASGSAVSTAPLAGIWRQITAIGGRNGYYYLNVLWKIRGLMDWLIGGPSFRTGRRDPDALRMGDIVDGWRVLGMKPNERLTLSMLMRAPGSGLQEFNIRERDGKRVVEMCAYWHPAGFWGLLYWFAHLPLYSPLVNGAVAEIARRAEALERETSVITASQ